MSIYWLTPQSIPATWNTKESKWPHLFGLKNGKVKRTLRRHLKMSPWMTEGKTALKQATYFVILSGYWVFWKSFQFFHFPDCYNMYTCPGTEGCCQPCSLPAAAGQTLGGFPDSHLWSHHRCSCSEGPVSDHSLDLECPGISQSLRCLDHFVQSVHTWILPHLQPLWFSPPPHHQVVETGAIEEGISPAQGWKWAKVSTEHI